MAAFILAAITIGADLIAQVLHLYYEFLWLDVIVHLVGGMALGAALIVLIGEQGKDLALMLAAVLAIAIGWEILEYLVGRAPALNAGIDTALDIASALVGAAVLYGVIRRRYNGVVAL